MADYKTIVYCRACKARMVYMKGEIKKNYCENCIKRMNKP